MFLLIVLRFDNPVERITKKSNGDKLVYIFKIFQLLLVKFQSMYTPSEYMIVDEMFVGLRGRCAFRMYIKSKLRKYGLKIMSLCNAKTHYLLNNLSSTVPITNTNCNINGDNWFISIELLDELKKISLT